MATENIKLGSKCRVYIGKTKDADINATDLTGFELVENENEFTLTYSVDAQEIDTKSAGKISMPGTESWELTFTTNAALTDAADTLLRGARNQSWPYLIVEDGTTKLFGGNFLMTGLEIGAQATGVREGSYTLKNSGEVKDFAVDDQTP